ncbi:MAG: sugar ABC transporter permease [Firmicutes bacterium HGW-Firmicutes-9]|jgi:raffinose/stachyose/melibiose transport system permease protein|nr:MAG: sugar ABC transporter permease [Firmicutes bacterium HGW-Firmicutes-9]
MSKSKHYPAYFLIGTLLLYVVLYLLPGLIGIGYSFTDWSAFSDKVNFLGYDHMFDNYIKAFSDVKYFGYLGNTLLFTFVTTIVKNVLGLALAVLLTRQVKLLNFHRAVMYIPAVLSALIVGMIFKSILHPADGLLNSTLKIFGIKGVKWLTDPKIAFWSVMGVDIWKGMGYIMTIFIAGIMSISPTYYEAAEIDGAGGWQKFRAITLPMLAPTMTVTTVLNVIYGLRVFDMVYALTNGGPGYVTEVLYTGIYKEFGYGKYAMGTTLSSIMFVFMAIIGYFLIRAMNRNEVEE